MTRAAPMPWEAPVMMATFWIELIFATSFSSRMSHLAQRDHAPAGGPFATTGVSLAIVRNAVSDSAGEARCDLLDQPPVAVGIVEGKERPVACALGIGAAEPGLGRERRAMPHLTGFDASADEIVVGRFDFGDGQTPHGRARRGRRDSRAERDGAGRSRRGELDEANVVTRGDVIVESPSQPFVELLGSFDVGYGDDVDLKVHVDQVDLPSAIRRPGFSGFQSRFEAQPHRFSGTPRS